MPRQSFDIREDDRSILVFLINQMQDTRRKIGSKMHGKKLITHWELKKGLPYFIIISISFS